MNCTEFTGARGIQHQVFWISALCYFYSLCFYSIFYPYSITIPDSFIMNEIPVQQAHGSRISCLPEELLIQILAHIHCPKALWSLRLVCHWIYRIVEPFLYCSVLLRSRSNYDSFSDSIFKHPERALHVKTLAFSFANEKIFDPLVVSIFRLMSNLQGLSIDAKQSRDESFDKLFGKEEWLPLMSNHLPFLTKCSSILTSGFIFNPFC